MTNDERAIDDIRSIKAEFDEEYQVLHSDYREIDGLVKVSSRVKISARNRSFDVIRGIFDDLGLVKVSSRVKISARNRSFDVIIGIFNDISLVKVSSHRGIEVFDDKSISPGQRYRKIQEISDGGGVARSLLHKKVRQCRASPVLVSKADDSPLQPKMASFSSHSTPKESDTTMVSEINVKNRFVLEPKPFLMGEQEKSLRIVKLQLPPYRLCDHLRSNVDLYTQSKESRPDEVAKQKPKETRPEESRRSKDWSTIRDPDELIANILAHDKSYMRQSPSPKPVIERKIDRSAEGGHKYERGQPDERSQVKVCATSPQICDTEHLFLKLPLLEPKLGEYLDKTSMEDSWSENAINSTYSWLKEGSRHRFITRDLQWGVPVPFDKFKDKTIYALLLSNSCYASSYLTNLLSEHRNLKAVTINGIRRGTISPSLYLQSGF
ncbi:probable methionine--tRNA ligase [Tanacetum coccineum]